jgi:hypothetical protein
VAILSTLSIFLWRLIVFVVLFHRCLICGFWAAVN